MFGSKNSEGGKQGFALGLVSGVAVISTLAFFILLVVFLSGGGDKVVDEDKKDVQVEENGDGPSPNLADIPAVSDDDYIRGDKDAPVTLVEYSDFECSFCAKHFDTMEQVLSEYKGKVRLVYRHFPLSFHVNAQKAAEAAECAGDQGKFWEMHDEIFDANGAGTMSVEKWKSVASSLGLNTSTFNDCLDSGEYASKIASHMRSGGAAGVQGTPATFVNGELVSGALPYESFKQIIDAVLAQ